MRAGEAARGILPTKVPAGGFVNLASPARTQHILYGDGLFKQGGGHMWPGMPNKTPFPPSWSSDKIMHEISGIATDPSSTWIQQTGAAGADFTNAGAPVRYEVQGIADGVPIRAIVEARGEGIITGHRVP